MKLKDLMLYAECDLEIRTTEDEILTEYEPKELRYLDIWKVTVNNNKMIVYLNYDKKEIKFELGY